MPAASAMPAMFLVSHKPPQWQISGWAMLIARQRNVEFGQIDETLAGGDRNVGFRRDFAKP